jgi:hypothetical protein
MGRDTFPYWPPGSPQRPSLIAGHQEALKLEDLAINQIPRGRHDEIPLRPVPVPRIRRPELPASPEKRNTGIFGDSLYDLYMQTEAMPREALLQVMMSTGGGEP